MEKKNEMISLNTDLYEEISIDELESRLELAQAAPKTCGQYTESPN